TGDNCYFQDLTLENEYQYYTDDNGRAVCLQDKGNHTICKNVKMLSYQDTYYSNNSTAEKYFETSDIHGTVDFICGDGAVYFQNCTITVEKRTAAGTGECTITAPNTATSATYGYVFNGCTIDNYAATYNYGRAWSNGPRCVFLNTILNDPDKLNSARWNTTGINTVPTEFLEYNTMNSDLTSIMPTSNTITFSGGGTTLELNTLMTSETDAKKYELATVFESSSWRPDTCTTQLDMGTVSQDEESEETTDATISWTAVDGALAYAIFKDGEFVEIIDGSSTSYEVTEDGTYTVRAANQYGGFGENSDECVATFISDALENSDVVKTVYYNLSGVRVSNAYKGVVIKVETMENGKQVATKIVK
ncbi:MAG: pectinesterase family protein, partial [Prevotella sp.]|nr:pectinesterase family protein [Prevotella sp.]